MIKQYICIDIYAKNVKKKKRKLKDLTFTDFVQSDLKILSYNCSNCNIISAVQKITWIFMIFSCFFFFLSCMFYSIIVCLLSVNHFAFNYTQYGDSNNIFPLSSTKKLSFNL